jgi:hypothetical protein
VDCGCGEVVRVLPVMVGVEWSPPPDAVGRAFLRSLPPRPETERPLAPAEDQHAQRWPEAVDRGMLAHRDGTPIEVALMWSGGMTLPRPDLLVQIRQDLRPTPAENARRYTSEEETW